MKIRFPKTEKVKGRRIIPLFKLSKAELEEHYRQSRRQNTLEICAKPLEKLRETVKIRETKVLRRRRTYLFRGA